MAKIRDEPDVCVLDAPGITPYSDRGDSVVGVESELDVWQRLG
jgi:hypothetical protein